jgi:NTE family protein
MIKEFDFSKEYGVVLEGGGAKGAYQIGVWKAFLECGVKIKGVSGVSVGALNGALICMGSYEEAENLWRSLTYSNIMNLDDEQMKHLMNLDIKNLDLKVLSRDTGKIISGRGIDITPLKELIQEWVDEEKIHNSPIEFIFGTFLVSKLKEIEITAQEADKASLKDYLLASALLPAFRNDKLNGQTFLDGGMFNNVPIDMLINRGYKDIIVVRIYGMGLEKPVKIPKDVNIIEIAPNINLGSILDFNTEKIHRNIEAGYYDAMRCLHDLTGRIYYIDSDLEEGESLHRLMKLNEAAKMAMLEYYKFDYGNTDLIERRFLEQVCPSLANTLRLKKDWNYTELYISLLELCAKSVRVPKYKIYTVEELKRICFEKYQKMLQRNYKLPIFHELVVKMMTI